MAGLLDVIGGLLQLGNQPAVQKALENLLHDVPEAKLLAALEQATKEATPVPAGYVLGTDGQLHKKG